MMIKFYTMIAIQLLLLLSFVSGTGLKHMRAHGKEDIHHNSVVTVADSPEEHHSIRSIHQLSNQSIVGVHIDGLPIFVKVNVFLKCFSKSLFV